MLIVGGPIKNISKGAISCAIASALQSKFGVGNVSFRHVVNTGRYVDTLAFGHTIVGYLKKLADMI